MNQIGYRPPLLRCNQSSTFAGHAKYGFREAEQSQTFSRAKVENPFLPDLSDGGEDVHQPGACWEGGRGESEDEVAEEEGERMEERDLITDNLGHIGR